MSNRKQPTLYRFFDQYGQLLYVGQSIDPIARFRQHRSEKDWWHQIAGITVQHTSEKELDRLEREAIENEHPVYNKQMNKQPGTITTENIVNQVYEIAAARSCTSINWGWIWYCEECQNHGTADSQQEANALATAHIAMRSLEDANFSEGQVGTFAECHWASIAVVQVKEGHQYIFGQADRFPADWVYHPFWSDGSKIDGDAA